MRHTENTYKRIRKRTGTAIIAVIYAAMMVITALTAGGTHVFAASDGYTAKLSEDFEKSTVTGAYANSTDNTRISYFGSESIIMVEDSAGSITGSRSLRLYNCDMRWDDLDIEDLSFHVGFSIKVGRNFKNEMKFMISTHDRTTSIESDGGTLLYIRNAQNGNTYLYGSDNTNLYELKKDTVYRISVEITRGKSECRLSVNGEDTGLSFKFRSAVYGINGMRIYVPYVERYVDQPENTAGTEPLSTPENSNGTGALTPANTYGPANAGTENDPGPTEMTGPEPTGIPGESQTDETGAPGTGDIPVGPTKEPEEEKPSNDNTLLIDNIFVSTKGREYPQPYSIQVPGKLPDLNLEDHTPDSRVRVYVNTKEIDMSKTYVTDNTVYISAEQFLKGISMEYTYDKNERILSITNNKLTVTARVPGNDITVNGNTVKLAYPVRTIDDVVMISPNFINEVFNCKVWWDRESKTLAVTTGSQKNDDILRLVGNKFYMNGEPYYEISFNKYDLFYQIWASYSNDSAYPTDEYREAAAETALKQLHDNGFRSIRVFCSAEVPDLMYDAVVKGKYYEAMDKMFDLCDRYDIKVVVSLGLISDNFVAKQKIAGYGLVNKSENKLDLVAVESSESRGLLAQYIREFVDRYRSRKTVLMYEIVDEGNMLADVGNSTRNVTFSLGQLADFYKFCGDTIRSVDNQRIITGGDSVLRNAQYNLFAGTMAGRLTDDWTTDETEERLYALSLLNYGTDVISAHTFGLGDMDSGVYYDSDGDREYYGFGFLMAEAEKIGKPFYNGETQIVKKLEGSEYAKAAGKYLDGVIEAGVQISHWWTFRSDRQGSNESIGSRNDSGEIFETIKEANRKLKEKYVVNGVGQENTFLAGWKTDDEIIDPEKIISGVQPSRETSNIDAIKWSLIIAASLTVVCTGIVILFRRRMKRGT